MDLVTLQLHTTITKHPLLDGSVRLDLHFDSNLIDSTMQKLV